MGAGRGREPPPTEAGEVLVLHLLIAVVGRDDLLDAYPAGMCRACSDTPAFSLRRVEHAADQAVMRGRSACTARGLADDLQADLKEVVALQG